MPAFAPVDNADETFHIEKEASSMMAEDAAELEDVAVDLDVFTVESEVDVAVGAKSKIAYAPQPVVSPRVTIIV